MGALVCQELTQTPKKHELEYIQTRVHVCAYTYGGHRTISGTVSTLVFKTRFLTSLDLAMFP